MGEAQRWVYRRWKIFFGWSIYYWGSVIWLLFSRQLRLGPIVKLAFPP